MAHVAPRDPTLATGTLPNGLRYYLRANKSPAHRAEFRLVVNAGSMLEDDDQKGFAHFLEHMAFNGTTNFPHNSVVDFIEESGMVFGADLNAETTADETVYRFQLPTDDPKLVSRGLDILEDWAGGRMNIDSTEVVGERGVIMGEWRLNTLVDTASQSYRTHYDSVWYANSRYLRRAPIGDTALLVKAEPAPIRRFYRDWYRPDLMAVVVVGDFDQQQMLGEITRRFGGIPASSRKRPRIEAQIKTTPELVDVYRGFVNPSVDVLWPEQRKPTAVDAAVRQQLIHDLLWQHLDHRLLAIREQVSRPFIIASVERGRVVRPIEVEGFNIVADPDSLNRALAAVFGELHRVVQHGMPSVALDREKAALLRGFEDAAGSELARTSDAYADLYEAHYLRGEGELLSAAQELALSKQLLPTITAASNRAGGEDTLGHAHDPAHSDWLAAFQSRAATHANEHPRALRFGRARADLTGARARGGRGKPLLAHEPVPGKITSETRDTVAGITTWTLSNGARVILKPTTNDPDEILLRAWGPGGFSRMPDSLFYSPGRMVAKLMTAAAGLGEESRGALERPLATSGLRAFKVNIDYGSESVDLAASPERSGRALPPAVRAIHLAQIRHGSDSQLGESGKVSGWRVHARRTSSIRSSLAGEDRLAPVATQMADLLHPNEALEAYQNRFGNPGQFTFFIVGATTPEKARPLVERYLASLPGNERARDGEAARGMPFYREVRQHGAGVRSAQGGDVGSLRRTDFHRRPTNTCVRAGSSTRSWW